MHVIHKLSWRSAAAWPHVWPCTGLDSVSPARAEDTMHIFPGNEGGIKCCDDMIGMMAATLERIEELDVGREEWSHYVERLGHFLQCKWH